MVQDDKRRPSPLPSLPSLQVPPLTHGVPLIRNPTMAIKTTLPSPTSLKGITIIHTSYSHMIRNTLSHTTTTAGPHSTDPTALPLPPGS